jgi:hypothetical protein
VSAGQASAGQAGTGQSSTGQASADGCGASAGGAALPAGAGNQAVVHGHVTRAGAAVQTGYARLLDSGGDFVAEVPLGTDGGFRFFAAPGTWTVRVLAPGGVTVDQAVTADYGQVSAVEVSV